MLPLLDKTIVVTRSQNQIQSSSILLKELGAKVIELSTIKIIEPDDWSQFDSLISSLKFNMIIFTSANGVSYFFNRLKKIKPEYDFSDVKILAVGLKTAKVCYELFSKVDIAPDEYSTKGIISTLKNFDLSKKNILIPKSEITTDELTLELKKNNANVFPVTVYKNILPDRSEVEEQIKLIKSSQIDVYIFTSPSTFRNFIELLDIKNPKDFFATTLVSAIGSTTKSELEKYELKNVLVPETFTFDSLVNKIVEHFTKGVNLDTTEK
jgi:uroporphyrinogen-III synthase